MKTVAVIPTKNRPGEYKRLLTQLIGVDEVVVIAHGPEAIRYVESPRTGLVIPTTLTAWFYEQPHYSRMMNIGIDYARGQLKADNIVCLNDDVQLQEHWVHNMISTMRSRKVDLVAPRRNGKSSGSPDIAGYAFVIDAASKLRYDERFVWWCGDDDLVQQADKFGRGHHIEDSDWAQVYHVGNNTTVGELAIIGREDILRFRTKWGKP